MTYDHIHKIYMYLAGQAVERRIGASATRITTTLLLLGPGPTCGVRVLNGEYIDI